MCSASLTTSVFALFATILPLSTLTVPLTAQCNPCAKAYDDPVLSTTCCRSYNITYAIKASTKVTLPIFAIQIMTNGTSGFLEIWSHDSKKNSPLQRIGGNPWISTVQTSQWKGVSFARPAVVQANSTFWVVLHVNPATAYPSVRAVVPKTGQYYTYSRNLGKTWLPGNTGLAWKYRLFCCRVPRKAAYSTFGSGCGASTTTIPALGFSGVPKLGGKFSVTVVTAAPIAPVLLTLGFSDRLWGPIKLPLDLALFGAPSCKLLASMDMTLPNASSAGQASQSILVPNMTSLMGLPIFNQWIVYNRKANTLGLTFSQGGIGVLGT